MGRLLAAAFLRLDSTCPSCVFISWRGFAVVCLAVAAGTVGRVSRRGAGHSSSSSSCSAASCYWWEAQPDRQRAGECRHTEQTPHPSLVLPGKTSNCSSLPWINGGGKTSWPRGQSWRSGGEGDRVQGVDGGDHQGAALSHNISWKRLMFKEVRRLELVDQFQETYDKGIY